MPPLQRPHSNRGFDHQLGQDKDGYWNVVQYQCPACERFFIFLVRIRAGGQEYRALVWPKGISRTPCPLEVPGDLSGEIDQVLSSLPSYLAGAIDAIRNVGNFAAHPQKSQQVGTIFPVEPGEAEWGLDVLEQLFDFYYVQPEVLAKKREAMNKKLQDAGKPPLK